MEKHKFIDRFFHSQYELLDFRNIKRRDANTLYSFLNNLHTVGDRLKEDFGCDIKSYPEFKILRIIRNYLHHVGDIEEIRLNVKIEGSVIVSHAEHLIIPLETFAKSIKSFIDKNTLPKNHKSYKRKNAFIEKELNTISEIYDYMHDLLDNIEIMCNKPSLKLDGQDYELGFDMYKFVYNITNIIAEKCREIEELKDKKVITGLGHTYTMEFNIGKYDALCQPSKAPIITTKGFVYPDKIERTT